MGVISTLATLGGLIRPATELTRTVRGDRAAQEAMDHEWREAVLRQLGAEFAQTPVSVFDGFVNGLNRLPRPALALGTLGLFVFAMVDPVRFAARMKGLELVPDPLWWLLGAIVSFYFGARELHYFRGARPKVSLEEVLAVTRAQDDLMAMGDAQMEPAQAGLLGVWRRDRRAQTSAEGRASDPDYNAALEDWRDGAGKAGA